MKSHNCEHTLCDEDCATRILERPFSSPMKIITKPVFGKQEEYVSDRRKNEINELTSNKLLFLVSPADDDK